jgi:protocatechuate 3,4-dioxygenase beta subunit
MKIPQPTPTPDGPTFEGRLLDRADEEIVDQGAAFDIRTVMSRRGVLGLAGLGLGAVVLAACTPAASSGTGSTTTPSATPSASAAPSATGTVSAEIPDETAGPYPGDGSNGPDVLTDSGIVRSDIRSSIDGGATADGVPLTFSLQIIDPANGGIPFAGAAVYAWHCTAQGEYSMYSDGLEDVTYLRGVQVADAEGRVSFTSIFPGCYSGRWPHIHFEVFPDLASITDASNAISTSQLALPEAVCATVYAESGYDGSTRNLNGITLASDNVFGEDSGELQLATVTGAIANGYIATLVVGVDTTTVPTAGGGRPPAN